MIKVLKRKYAYTWQILFEIANLGDLDKPLTPAILADPNSKDTQHYLYIYSMASFIYPELNRASRKKDQSKIKFYGPFAAALSYIIYFANMKRVTEKLYDTTKLCRGLKLMKEEVDCYKVDDFVHLMGYTSTSMDAQVALRFALQEPNPETIPVVFEIQFKGDTGLFKMTQGYSTILISN